ncbi:3,4-dihydroxy-2-butanone-4-phosphate synthase [Amycolatopsis saalfeldensis]|uniref:3,4-dihydroxy-2-butanone-4-phosphate synthase n=1 Tax=Amycolatopsis saalfeldensis TaxID=394193 RepID=A0A1H8U4H1_9PSEU|nr:3,4-dihydroxy-2-butanone-4-phosphate synthase [Amycolatopsis saalfeldensis]SEO98170.1 GTP cyclohydrolase II /3,4-dihydroxy-2-butanone 4-phosphate synthase [Amycolatopsis saalfeldensis]
MDTVEQALAEIAAGRPVVVLDGPDRENEGDLIVAADRVTPATMAFVVRHSSGFVCVALPQPECERLALPPMHHRNDDRFGTAYRVTVDAAAGIGTGISARDRACTARLLAASTTRPADLNRPGHVVPLAARPGGVLERAGHTEAAVDLTRLAGLRPAGVLCEVVSAREPSRMARRPELSDFAGERGLAMITIEDLIAYRRATEAAAERVASVRLPTEGGTLRTVGYRGVPDGAEHVALVAGEARGADVPVHVHVECVPGDVFGSRQCGCARRLETALREINAAHRGVIVYLRPAGGSPLRALLGDAGAGCGRADPAVAASILADLGVTSIRHLHNPAATRGALDAALAAAPGAAPRGAVA